MISAKAAYWLNDYRSRYFNHVEYEQKYWRDRERDFGIAMAIIPQVLSPTETRMCIRIHNPMHDGEIGTYAHLDTMHPDNAEAYIEEIKAFFKEIHYHDDTVIRLMPELSDTVP